MRAICDLIPFKNICELSGIWMLHHMSIIQHNRLSTETRVNAVVYAALNVVSVGTW